MKYVKALIQIRKRRAKRTRAKISGDEKRPRLSVFRSNTHTHLQLIDDKTHRTLASVSTKELAAAEQKKNKVEQAHLIGVLLAKKALSLKIAQVVFDRGRYRYHGRVKAVALGAQEAGLKI